MLGPTRAFRCYALPSSSYSSSANVYSYGYCYSWASCLHTSSGLFVEPAQASPGGALRGQVYGNPPWVEALASAGVL